MALGYIDAAAWRI